MKKMMWILVGFAMLYACNTQQKEIEGLTAKSDSLAAVNIQQGESIIGFVASFNDIQQTLDSIKQMEKIITLNAGQPGSELEQDAKDRINQDIFAIHSMLRRNREMVANLKSRLKKSDGKIVELEKMIEFMTRQIEEKDGEIVQLKDQLAKMNIKVEELAGKVENLASESQAKSQVIEEKTSELNTAFYAIGTKKELTDNKVITREGGFIGIGKASQLAKDFNTDYFTRIDIRNLKYVVLNTKKAKVVTTHPAGSFKITGIKKADTLFISDYNKFWSASKYLVIQVD